MTETAFGACEVRKWPAANEMLLSLPGEWYDRLHVQKGSQDRIVLRAGNRRAVAQAVFTDESEVQMTDALREQLLVPLGRLSAKALNGELHFGPFVGVYAAMSGQQGKPFGELTGMFQDMMALAEQQGVCLYVITPGDVNWQEGHAFGYVYKAAQKQWVRTRRPLPDLVMQKIMRVPADARVRVRRDLQRIAEQVPHGLFNRATGNKWEVHQTLFEKEETRELLPETRAVRSPSDLEEMVEQFGSVFVKPAFGTQGRSIFRFRMEGRVVRAHYTSGGKTFVKKFHRDGPKWPLFVRKTFCGRRLFLVQEALDLLMVQTVRPVDFRWLVQKDGDGEWQVTAQVARIGRLSAITTNLHTGGQALAAEEVLKASRFKQPGVRQELLKRMDEAALAVARALEEKAGRLGEIGIDFGLTRTGRVYLIEVNPRPGRQMLKQTSLAVRALSLQRNLEYAKYTTGYQTSRE